MIKKTAIEKFLNWEHWPSFMFYVPNLPYAFYLAIRAKHPTFFSIANPAIKSSGNGTESKYTTIQLVPKEFRPLSILIQPNSNFQYVLDEINKKNISFPIIAKPDIGFRGLLVEKINSKKSLQHYLEKYPIPIIIQEFLNYENECGIFYHRNPSSKKGTITSLTLKSFLSVTGDGKSTLKELILKNNRATLYLDLFEKIHQERLMTIPKKNEVIKLTAIGNHSKGTQFINGNHLISKDLERIFDDLSNAISGWYYGRVDVKYNSFEDFTKGGNFKIVEINGIIAEPTHIYDSKNYTYYKALKTIRTHWKSLFNIAMSNHKDFKIPYKSSRKFIREMFELRAYTKKIAKLAKN